MSDQLKFTTKPETGICDACGAKKIEYPSETYTALCLGALLRGFMINGHKQDVKANWTAKGSEAVIEFEGQFYRVTVEPLRP